MEPVIFDGKAFALDIYNLLNDELRKRKPKLVTIYDPENEGARKYTEIKEKKADELGIQFEKFQILNLKFEIKDQIIKFNNDPNIDGIMIQLPLINKKVDEGLCKLIDPKKDVDGLNPESGVVPATARAVLEILKHALQIPNSKFQITNNFQISNFKFQICIVGNKGIVGSAIEKRLVHDSRFTVMGMDKEDFDPEQCRRADVIISATGVPGLIKPEMVKDGVICIDVGYPKGDFDPEVATKAAFFTPVPGGVGPVTVAMLFRNLFDLQ